MRLFAPRASLASACLLVASSSAQTLVLHPPTPDGLVTSAAAYFRGEVVGTPGPAPCAKILVRTRYPDGSLTPPLREDGAYDPSVLGWGYALQWDEVAGRGCFDATAQMLAVGQNFLDVYFPGDSLGAPRGTLELNFVPPELELSPIVVGAHALQRSVDVLDANGQAGVLGFRVDLIAPEASGSVAFELFAQLVLPDQGVIDLPIGVSGALGLSVVLAAGDMSKVSTTDPEGTLFRFSLDQAPFPQPTPEGLYQLRLEARSGLDVLYCNEDIAYWVADRTAKPFRDVTAEAGLDVVALQSGINPEAGSCATTFDYDGDGLTDIFVSNPSGAGTALPIGTNWMFPGGRNWLLRNNGDGTFSDRTMEAGVAGFSTVSSYGVTWGDLDRDGDNDLVVANRAFRFHVYRNNGDGSFTDVYATSFSAPSAQWWMAPRLGDWDDDGDLDLYCAGYVKTFLSTWQSTGWASRLYRNLLVEGQLDPLAPGFPIFQTVNGSGAVSSGLALGACFVDYDRDGALDLAVQHDFGAFAVPNKLFRGQGNGTFVDVSAGTGYDVREFSMGVVFGDLDGDLWLDAYSTSLGRDSLLRGSPSGLFAQAIEGSGAEGAFTLHGPEADGIRLDNSWGPLLWDYDWDGDWDLTVAGSAMFTNGNMSIARAHADASYRNDGNLSFTPVAEELGLANAARSRAVFAIDYDNDGDDDLLSVAHNEGLTLMRNDLPRRAHSLRLRPRTQRSAPGGFNTFLRVTPPGGATRVHELLAESSSCGQADNVQRFGLGSATQAEVMAEWTSGGSTTWFRLAGDAEHVLYESLLTLDGALDAGVEPGDTPLARLLGRPGALVVGLIGDPSSSSVFQFPTGESLDLDPLLAPPFFTLGVLDMQGTLAWPLGTVPASAHGLELRLQLLELDATSFAPLAKSSLSSLRVL